jgi:hypothetical protein
MQLKWTTNALSVLPGGNSFCQQPGVKAVSNGATA